MTTTMGTTTSTAVQTTPRIQPWRWPWIHLFEPAHFVVRELPLDIEGLPDALDGFRIVAISDLHLTDVWYKAYERATDTVAALQADLLLIAGDIVDNKWDYEPALPIVKRLLPDLRSRLGSYAILGNHDRPGLAGELESVGVQMVMGQRTTIDTGNGIVELIGGPGPKREHWFDAFPKQFGPPQPGIPRLLMAHFPDFFPRLRSLHPDLYLCGHTHAGQVCLPGGIPLVWHDTQPRNLCRGYHRFGRTHYIVSQGFGFSGLPIRFFCPPEILLLVLRRA